MKQIFVKLAAFFSIALLLGCVLQIAISLFIEDRNFTGSDTLHIHDQEAGLVFLGSSRCWSHFDPRFFERAFGIKSINIGVSGHSEIALTRLRLESYLAKNKAPEFAVFNFDPMASADSVNSGDNFVIKNELARYAFLPPKADEPIIDFFKFNLAEKYIPAYALLRYKWVQICILSKPSYYTKYGYDNNASKWDTLKTPVTGLMKKYYFKDSEVPAISRQLELLHDVCQKHRIKLICIQTPVYKSIYDARFFSRNKKICDRLGIAYLDMESPVFRENIDFFYNSNHLNRNGVEKMNALLKENKMLRRFLGIKSPKSSLQSRSKS